MNAMLASMLRGIGIDPDHPETFIDRLLAPMGVNSAMLKQMLKDWADALKTFDNRQLEHLSEIKALREEVAELKALLAPTEKVE